MRFLDGLYGLFGFLAIFDWLTPTIQMAKSVMEDIPKMVRLQPVDAFIEIYGADFPRAYGILDTFEVRPGWLDIIIPPFYPFVYWKGVRVPNAKETEILTAFDMAGIRYKA